MKPFIAAIVVAVGMAVLAAMVLEGSQMSTAAKYTTSAVRN
jgi:hypothetical protein